MDQQTASRPAGNLPVIASSFVGRHRELADVRHQMEGSRLLTLTGPGGVGKTRLAIQAGLRARRGFPDGVWLVDLAAVEDATRLADAVAATVGVKDQSARLAGQQLADYLENRCLLMLLDNCEHLVAACAGLVDSMLRRAPALRVLATSRQPLGLPGEQVLAVDPLPVPAAGRTPPAEALVRYDAVALFTDRAAAVQPGFRVHEGNRETVARLCARLDGLPLAIELAATRLRSLSVEQVDGRLDDRFRLLTGGSPAALSRQQTLRALMDWSYDLCTGQERQLWAALSVFPAEFDLDAVEGICAGPGTGIEPGTVLDLLDGLVAKSVVSARTVSPRARYRLLETVRQYGREILAGSSLERELRRRHRDYYLDLAVHACQAWCGPGQSENLTRLDLERDNLDSALDWSLAEPGESAAALIMASALRYHWTLGGYLAAGRRRLEQVLHAAGGSTPGRGDALWVAAWVALLQGDGATAMDWLRQCAEIAGSHHDDHLHAYVLVLTGTRDLFSDDPAAAARHFAAGIDLMRKQDDYAAVLWGMFQHIVALTQCGDSKSAQSVSAEAIQIAEERRETWARSEAIWACGFDRWVAGDPDGTAAGLVREAIELTPNANHVSTVLGVELLAWIAASKSRYDEAARLLGAAHAIWNSLGTTIAAFGPIFSRYSERCRADATAALGEARFRKLAEEGSLRRPGTLHPARSAPAPQAPSRSADAETLTRREREVGRLIAMGLTNKAIAARLVLSPRTVDGHVERLFAKIGVTTRAQAAVWMAEHQAETC